MTHLELLENEVSLKQLQISRLLGITQAINDNVSAKDLYRMYNSILEWEMGINKMALFARQGTEWSCVTSINVDKMLIKTEVVEDLKQYNRLTTVGEGEEDELLQLFDIVLPVKHKDEAIAFCLLGGFDENEDIYEKIRFITTITNIIAVAIENKRLFKDQIAQERLKKEMEVAKKVQHMLIPDQDELPKTEDYEFSSIYKPHLEIGGDCFDCIVLDEDKIAFYLGDISGKGIGAALLMANFQSTIRILVEQDYRMMDFIKKLNEAVLRITKGDKFITFFFAIYSKERGKLYYINAGHNPPVMIQNNELIWLSKGCTILGALDELPEIEVGQATITDDSMIVTFTDGLTDIQNDDDEYFNEALLEDFSLENANLNTTKFNDKLLNHITTFKGDNPFPDDIAVLTCKIFK